MRTPQVADMVLAVLPSPSNGTDVAPAIITRVWGQHPEGGWTINAHAFPDGFFTPQVWTSARLVEAEDVARAITQGGGRGAWTR